MSARPSAAGAGSALAFFDDVHVAYRQAAAAAGACAYTFRIGGHTIRLAMAGPSLARVITPALDHLRADGDVAADLTIFLWDVASTGVALPRCPWDWQANPARGDIVGLSDERFQVAYNQFARTLSLLDCQQNVALWCAADARGSASYIGATPLLDILHWWLQQRGVQTVHGGAVGTAAGGVLLVGKGGSGKSTTTLACLRSALGFAGDDYCALSTQGAPEVYSLYSSARVEVDSLERLPQLRTLLSGRAVLPGNGAKATIFLQQHYPEKLVKRFPLRALLLPQVSGEPGSRLQPTSAMQLFKELTVTTISQRAGAGKGAFAGIAAVVRQVPCYSLALGTDLEQLAQLLSDFVCAAPQPPSPR